VANRYSLTKEFRRLVDAAAFEEDEMKVISADKHFVMAATGLSGGADFDICPLTVRSTPVGDFSGLLTNSDVVAHHSSLYVAMPLLEAKCVLLIC
jgi:hypothetical protein